MKPQLIHNKKLLLASLKMSNHMMKVKRPYTEFERVVLPCLEIAADLIPGGTKAVDKIKQIPLSDIKQNLTVGRCAVKTTTNSEDIESPLFWHTAGRKH